LSAYPVRPPQPNAGGSGARYLKQGREGEKMTRIWTAAIACVLSLAACEHLPNSVSPDGSVEQTYGTITAATPLATIVREKHIQPLNPGSQKPLLDQAMTELRKTDPAGHYGGITYNLTKNNALDRDWLIQTPAAWGRHSAEVSYIPLKCPGCEPDVLLPSCRSDADCQGTGGTCGRLAMLDASSTVPQGRVCLGQSDAVVDRFYRLVAGAKRTVDIAALQPPPDYRFLAALRNGVTKLAHSGRAVTIRILIGQYPPDGTDAKALLSQLVRDAQAVRNSRITVYSAAMRSCAGDPSCGAFSWNHAKIVAIDGKAALVGGHNMWSEDYLIDEPVHDLSMQLRGAAAADADHFADSLWQFVCGHEGGDAAVSSFMYRSGDAAIGPGCLPRIDVTARQAAEGAGIPVLSVGRLGAGITTDFASHDDLARDLIFGAARHSIRVAQQDVGISQLGRPDAIYPDSALEHWADFMLAGRGDVYLVLSNLDAKGRSKSTYSNSLPIEAVADKMLQTAQARSTLPRPALVDLLCSRFHLASFRFGPDATWPDKQPIGNHSKFWMVDDRYFYIGSDNLYPVDLQEFGYIVDDRTAAAELLKSYWEPLWRWSRPTAISGNDASRCVLRRTEGS
jgi:phosphatidylserine/phosphatidylglycerophosphate/cardiolipin synthase-like enzyme